MQSLKTEIGAEIRDAQGRLIRRIPFRRCHSLLKQLIQLLAVQMSQLSRMIKAVDGTEYSTGTSTANFRCGGTAGATNYGIQIGNGNTAVTMADHVLESQLTANITYQGTAFAEEHPDASTWRLAITRGFLNNTGGELSIKEVGLVSFNASKATLLDRTLYPVSFNAGETLTLTYRITIAL